MFRRLLLWLFPSVHVLKVDWTRDSHDTAYMLLDTAFNAMIRYVEVEKAMIWVVTHPEVKKQGPRWWNSWWWHSADFGVKRLKEETAYKLSNGKEAETARVAKELLELYDWWKNRRVTIEMVHAQYGSTNIDEIDKLLKAENDIETKNDEMFRRLAEIRKYLVS